MSLYTDVNFMFKMYFVLGYITVNRIINQELLIALSCHFNKY